MSDCCSRRTSSISAPTSAQWAPAYGERLGAALGARVWPTQLLKRVLPLWTRRNDQGSAFDALSGSTQARAQREVFRKHIGHARRKKHRDADPEQRRMMDVPLVAFWGFGLCTMMVAMTSHANPFPPRRRRRTIEPLIGQRSQKTVHPMTQLLNRRCEVGNELIDRSWRIMSIGWRSLTHGF